MASAISACSTPSSSATRPWRLRADAEKEELARSLGADDYIDSAAVDPGAALQSLGGAAVIVATAASGASMSPLVAGLAPRGRLVVVGAAPDPISVDTSDLIFGGRSIVGSLTGISIENEENLAFSLAHGVKPMRRSCRSTTHRRRTSG